MIGVTDIRDITPQKITERDLSFGQRYALAALVGYNEGLVASGVLDVRAESALRRYIANTLAAFDMPAKADIAPAVRTVRVGDHTAEPALDIKTALENGDSR